MDQSSVMAQRPSSSTPWVIALAALPTLKPSVPSKMLTCRSSNVGVEHGDVDLGRAVQQGDLGARLEGRGLLVLELEGARRHAGELTWSSRSAG